MLRKYGIIALLASGCSLFQAGTVDARVQCTAEKRCTVSVDERVLFDDTVDRIFAEVWSTSGFNGTADAVYVRLAVVQDGRETHVNVPVRCTNMAEAVRQTRVLDPLTGPVDLHLHCAPQTR